MTEADVKRLVKQALEKAEEEKAEEVQEEATTSSESEEERHSKKEKKKKASGRKKKSKDTSGSSGSEESDDDDEDEFYDHLVDAWAPKNWKDASTMLQRFDGVEQTITNRTMLGPHLRGELDFIRRLVKMSARFQDKKLQAIIGRNKS